LDVDTRGANGGIVEGTEKVESLTEGGVRRLRVVGGGNRGEGFLGASGEKTGEKCVGGGGGGGAPNDGFHKNFGLGDRGPLKKGERHF